MIDNEKTIEELQAAAQWFTEHGRNTNTAVIGICERAVDLINSQKERIAELQKREAYLLQKVKERNLEIERLKSMNRISRILH